jgi:hypothetical protein
MAGRLAGAALAIAALAVAGTGCGAASPGSAGPKADTVETAERALPAAADVWPGATGLRSQYAGGRVPLIEFCPGVKRV